MKPAVLFLLQTIFCTIGYSCAITDPILAQVTPDNTSVDTQVNQNDNVAEVTGGQTRGSNQFHSFDSFSVPTGNEAFFNNADNISNIFSRVTGGNISNIDGLIRANGSANLFLINPAGIIFGEGASLDIGGSFYSSSASSILFEDGEFSAADLENPPLLTVNAPIGLSFRDNPGDITNNSVANNGNGLTVAAGNNLSLLGGNVTFDNGIISAPGANINLGGLVEAGTIAIDNERLSFPETVRRGNVSISNTSLILVQGDGGGSINVDANNFELLSGSLFFAGIDAGLGTPETQAGDITINAQENVEINSQGAGLTAIFNINNAMGDLGNISITARNITFQNGGNITNANLGQGNIGQVDLVATENITFDGIEDAAISGVLNSTFEAAQGNSSLININLTAQNLSVTNGARISDLLNGTGNSGDINLNIAETIMITGAGEEVPLDDGTLGTLASNVMTVVSSEGVGDAGDININTQNLILSDGGEIQASTTGQGNAGDISITASTINIGGESNNSSSFSIISSLANSDLTNNPDAIANGGDIQINTGILSLRDGGRIITVNSAVGNGNGGNVTINATNSITIDGVTANGIPSGIITAIVDKSTVGNSGNIQINTPKLSLANEAQVTTFTLGQGNAGDISIFAADFLELEGTSLISVSVGEEGMGNGGDLTIETNQLSIRNAGQILADTLGEGNAGSLFIRATDFVELTGNNSFISAGVESDAIGNGGNLNLETGTLTVADSGEITVESLGEGTSGNLTIDANSIQLDNGTIDAATPVGEGGSINLRVSEDVVLQGDSLISAQASNNANGGNLNIDTRFVIAFPNGNNDIIANAEQGNGGNINISAESLLGIQERSLNDSTNDINASSEFSLNGDITINTSDVNPIQGATELPTNVIVAEETTQQACQADRESAARNRLNITGKGGIIAEPGLPLNSLNVAVNGENNPTSTVPAPIKTSQGKIQPAKGVAVTKSGEVILTAYRTNNRGDRMPEVQPNCR